VSRLRLTDVSGAGAQPVSDVPLHRAMLRRRPTTVSRRYRRDLEVSAGSRDGCRQQVAGALSHDRSRRGRRSGSARSSRPARRARRLLLRRTVVTTDTRGIRLCVEPLTAFGRRAPGARSTHSRRAPTAIHAVTSIGQTVAHRRGRIPSLPPRLQHPRRPGHQRSDRTRPDHRRRR
jgi:hypothetical protein